MPVQPLEPTNSIEVDLPPMSVRAAVSSFNPDTRTADVIFSTGSDVERFDHMTGQRYIERLEISPSALRLIRLNAGAPLLDSHSGFSISDQIGVVVPGSARIDRGVALATVRFSAREQVAPIRQDVADGVIRSVSVGYRVYKSVEREARRGELPIRTAVDWEPHELSLVSMPADIGARVRFDRSEHARPNRCVIVREAADADRARRLQLVRVKFV